MTILKPAVGAEPKTTGALARRMLVATSQAV